jgi:hypothetical protein
VPSITLTLSGETYPIDADPKKFTAAELNAVERHTGMTVREWGEKLSDNRLSSLAWTALAWIAVRRSGRFVRWDDFEAGVSVQDIFAGIQSVPDPEPTPEPEPTPDAESTPPPPAPRIRKKPAATSS